MNPETNAAVLSELEVNLIQASGGKRFLNLIIDTIAFYILAFVVGMLWVIINPESAVEYTDEETKTIGTLLAENLIGIIVYVMYFFTMEALFKGKTLGKILTGTRAVNEDGSPISAQTAFLRALSRIVPFEAFSALGSPSYPWHDKWTSTYVIDEKQSELPLQ